MEVYCDGCDKFHSTGSVKHIDYTCDSQERDNLIFICPVDNKKHTGLVIRNYPA